ncbi:Putative cobalt-zinc-cadmium efflux permease OS=Streptomyces glaucescens OX=1907 GN=SGLAU_28220 PE=4 SV=1 [Streptomyces glaucescens]
MGLGTITGTLTGRAAGATASAAYRGRLRWRWRSPSSSWSCRSSAVCSPTRSPWSPTRRTWPRTRWASAWRCWPSTSRNWPPSDRRTFGYARAEILAALANCLLLLGVGGYILFEVIERFVTPAGTDGGLAVVRVIGLVANMVSLGLPTAGRRRASTCAAPSWRWRRTHWAR